VWKNFDIGWKNFETVAKKFNNFDWSIRLENYLTARAASREYRNSFDLLHPLAPLLVEQCIELIAKLTFAARMG